MSNQTRILVIDDDENITKVVASILEDQGYSVDIAGTGTEAIKKTQTNQYNLMLVDIRLPDMEGIEILNKIRDTIPKIRKIIVTGYPTLQNAVTAINRGADAYIIKPIEPEELLKIVKEKIREQKDAESMTEDKVGEWVEKRIKKLDYNE